MSHPAARSPERHLRPPAFSLAKALIAGLVCCGAMGASPAPPASDPVYIGDHPELIVISRQDWGVPGINVAAHLADKEGEPLRIGETNYSKGLGHHANGVITLFLDGQYMAFEAMVGVQPCPGGSVVFRAFVDGQKRFESGTVRSGQPAVPVHIELSGARELRLEASDAGDGIACDMANWAEARLIPAADQALRTVSASLDMAPFGRVVTWDPKRKHGAVASRVEEFRAEDLFTETDLVPRESGFYEVPIIEGEGCIGIQWLNRRKVKELALECALDSQFLSADGVKVEGWFGESAWQGQWEPLAGELRKNGNRLVFSVGNKAGILETSKVRWLLPTTAPRLPVRLTAFTRSVWATTNLFVQLEKPTRRAKVTVWNGEVVSPAKDRSGGWSLSRPLELTVRYSRPSALNTDPTLLQFRLPRGGVSVAVADVLSNECVYLPDYGLFVARSPLPVTLSEYKRSIAGRRSILEEVRSRPDQTLAQAMERTHHDFQREGPVMLSLACDNTKFVLDRNGTLRFHPGPFEWLAMHRQVNWQPWHEEGGEMRPQYGSGSATSFDRRLEGGWLPIVVNTVESDGIRYAQRSFVAPCGPPAEAPGTQKSIGVVEFTATNGNSASAEARIRLSFLAAAKPARPARLIAENERVLVCDGDRAVGLVDLGKSNVLFPAVTGGDLSLRGRLAPGEQTSLRAYLAGEGMSADEIAAFSPATALDREATRYWRRLLGPAMQVETPDDLLNNLFRSSQVRCLIDARSEAKGSRVAASIAAMAYGPLESEAHSVIRGMDFTGHPEFARRGLEFFAHRYNTNGFLTTGYTTFGTAWHLWTVGEHYELTGDAAWLRRLAPELARVCDWVVRQLDKTKRRAPSGQLVPEYGLMPPGVLADWNAFAFHYAMNAYYAAGLQRVGAALKDIGHPRGPEFVRTAAGLRANTLRAYAWTQAQSPALALRDGTWVPHYPSQVHSPGRLGEFFPGQDAGRSWCYDVELGAHQLVPAGVLDSRSREVERMMDHLEDVHFLSDGWFDYPAPANQADWFNLGGFSKVQPYYTRNCEIYALRDDVKPFLRSYFNSIASLLNPEVLTFWEHFHHSGAWDKTHETGYFLHQTRTMLVQERGQDLWIAPFVPANWLQDGRRVDVRNAPTSFGLVSYHLRSRVGQRFIEATIEPPGRRAPRNIVLRLRHPEGKPIRSVMVNGRRSRAFDPVGDTIQLSAPKQILAIQAFF